MELAYRLAVSERPEIRAIRENAVVLITPVVEPDGRDRQVEWYYRHVRGKDLPGRRSREIIAPLLGPLRLPRQQPRRHAAHPGPDAGRPRRFWRLPSAGDARPARVGAAPLHLDRPRPLQPGGRSGDDQRVDAARRTTRPARWRPRGCPGVWTWGFWDGWWPGYLISVANNHHAIGRFYETFGNSSAGTFERDSTRSSSPASR